MTYTILNLLVLVAIVTVTTAYTKQRPNNLFWITVFILSILTLVFDSLIVMSGIVDYNPDTILGIYLWRAPIEDFAYTAASVSMVVLLWEYNEREGKTNDK